MADRPNILFITSHDLGRHLGCYGVETVASPQLDGLAADGVRLAQCFCSAPQCSPSRSSMFTGRWPHSNGVMGLCHGDFGWDLHDTEQHLGKLLQQAGYTTAYAGHPHETRRPEFFGLETRIPFRGGTAPSIAEAGGKWLTEQAGHPWYLQVQFFEPHRAKVGFGAEPDITRGVTIPPYLQHELSAYDEFANFQGAIKRLDQGIGMLLEALGRSGQLDNTLVWFVADHGIPFPRAKCAVYDPGLEVATILRWPSGGLSGGRVLQPLLSNVDYLPTICDLLGLETPAAVQGRSFEPLLRGRAYTPPEAIYGEMTYHDYCDPRRCIRTETHKLIANFTSAPFFMDPSQSWRRGTVTVDPDNPPYAYHPPVELYDLLQDPLETHNLAGDEAHETLCAELLKRLHGWMVETSDPLLQGIPNSPLHERTLAALRGEDG